MKRVLIASSRNWIGAARLPSTLGPAGFTVDLIDRGGSQAASSSWVSGRRAVKGTLDDLAADVLAAAPAYDRVIVCDEFLLMALAAAADERSEPFLPAPGHILSIMLDKTRFPSLAAAAGLRVASSLVATTKEEVVAGFAELGSPVFIKGRHGVGGTAVRQVFDALAAVEVAATLGYPVLLEEHREGVSGLIPCLFERGRLVAALAADRVLTMREFAPSTVCALRPVDPVLREIAERAGGFLGLHGFVSIDFIDPRDGLEPVVLEINPRPVPHLHLGARAGADMAVALRGVIEGVFDGTPVLGVSTERVSLFPQELQRLRSVHGTAAGTMRWLVAPGALADVPWSDMPLVWRHMTRQG